MHKFGIPCIRLWPIFVFKCVADFYLQYQKETKVATSELKILKRENEYTTNTLTYIHRTATYVHRILRDELNVFQYNRQQKCLLFHFAAGCSRRKKAGFPRA